MNKLRERLGSLFLRIAFWLLEPYWLPFTELDIGREDENR